MNLFQTLLDEFICFLDSCQLVNSYSVVDLNERITSKSNPHIKSQVMLLESNIHGYLVESAVNTMPASKQPAAEIIYSDLDYFRKLWLSYM